MVNVFKFIKAERTKARQQGNVKRAKKLQKLREKRLYMEGSAKLVSAEKKEKERIAKAKETVRQGSAVYKIGKAFQGHTKKVGERRKKNQSRLLGGGPDFMGGGPDIGSSPGPDFDLGGKKKKKYGY